MVPLPFTLQTFYPIVSVKRPVGRARMRYDAGFRWGMGRLRLKIVLSLAGAGAVGFCVFVLLEAMLPGAMQPTPAPCSFAFN